MMSSRIYMYRNVFFASALHFTFEGISRLKYTNFKLHKVYSRSLVI